MITLSQNVCFLIPPSQKCIIRDYAGGNGFENTQNREDAYFLPPMDMVQLASCIKNEFNVFVMDSEAENLSLDQIKASLNANETKVAVVKVSFPTFKTDLLFIKSIKMLVPFIIVKIETTDIRILKKILENKFIKACLISECERNIGDILKGNDLCGTAYMKGQDVIVNNSYEPVTDLDILPFPDRELLKQNLYFYPKLGCCATILASRGCPYPCGYYCPYPLTQGKAWRTKSISRVIDELKMIVTSGINRVLFRDAVFSLNVKRAIDICDGIIREQLQIDWWCETRADKLPNELIEKLAEAGCKGVNIGVESGDPVLRHAHLKRGVPDELLKEICDTSRSYNIKVCFLLMVGYPGENRKSILNTAVLLINCRPYDIGLNYPVNYPGTQLDTDSIQNRWVKDRLNLENLDGSKPVIIANGLTRKEMIRAKEMINELFKEIKNGNEKNIRASFSKIEKWALK